MRRFRFLSVVLSFIVAVVVFTPSAALMTTVQNQQTAAAEFSFLPSEQPHRLAQLPGNYAYYPDKIQVSIPSIEVETWVVTAKNGDWRAMEDYPIWLTDARFSDFRHGESPWFGQPRVTLVFGHRTWHQKLKVFAKLDELQLGDYALVGKFKYKVISSETLTEAKVVEQYLKINKDYIDRGLSGMMLITCAPLWTTKYQLAVMFNTYRPIEIKWK
jgi:hypothetical protein